MRCLKLKIPSKVTTYSDSILATFPKLMKKLNKQEMSPKELFSATRRYFDDVGEFVEALDCLFILNKICINKETGELYSVKTNLL